MNTHVSHRRSEMNMTPQMLARRAVVGLLALLLMLLGSATAALAHDAVTDTSPANGSTVDSVPEKIQISMTNTPAVIGSQVLILDASGTNWAEGGVDVLDKVATQRVRTGAPAGKYTVKWRLVSSDSHPIEGEFSFTAMAAGAAAPPAAVSTDGQGVGAGPLASVQPEPASAPENVQNDSAVPWSVIGLGVVLVGVVVAMVLVARKRLTDEK
ncbi:copper resistance CopC family protein [Arthrobacter polaris]|uniref:copper resistance CopC family protein n=1 Tax=Arthrobacter polaris TaxID=2813727 RepID=UPI001F476DB2|nr:copper resistance CopC family protein [Arthrobacter polaris]